VSDPALEAMVSGASAIGGKKKRGVQIGGGGGGSGGGGGGGGGLTALQAAQAEQMEHLQMREAWVGLAGDTPQTLQAASNARELQAAIDRYQVNEEEGSNSGLRMNGILTAPLTPPNPSSPSQRPKDLERSTW